MSGFDAERFGAWLETAFRESPLKSYAELARRIGVSRTYISNLVGAKRQYVSDKPIRPSEEKVINLAKVLKKDVSEALLLAGYAPLTQDADPLLIDIGEDVKIAFFNSEQWDEETRKRAIESVRDVIAGIIAREEKQKRESAD